VIAAPFAAWLVRHIPARVLGTAAGGVIVLTNTRTILMTNGAGGTLVLAAVVGVLVVWAVLVARAIGHERAFRAGQKAIEVAAA
jgi:hypothetical protein